jgi:ribosomal protein S18 acetylase RimI-like enzyme
MIEIAGAQMESIAKNISFRRLRSEDADQIGVIYEQLTKKPVKGDFNRLTGEHPVKDMEGFKRLVLEHVDKGEDAAHFVAEMDGKIVGFMISYILTLVFGIDKSAWIAVMGISPKHMGQGIGVGMANEVYNFYKARGVTNVYTSVRWDSADLLSFFKTLGFERSNFINLKKKLIPHPDCASQ